MKLNFLNYLMCYCRLTEHIECKELSRDSEQWWGWGSTIQKCCHRSPLILYVPIVSKINFLLTITIDCQEQSLQELIK